MRDVTDLKLIVKLVKLYDVLFRVNKLLWWTSTALWQVLLQQIHFVKWMQTKLTDVHFAFVFVAMYRLGGLHHDGKLINIVDQLPRVLKIF